MPIEKLVPERFRGRHPSHRENFNAHPRTRQMGASMKLFALRKDGTEFPVDIMLRPIGTAAGPVTISFVRDTTEQREAQEELRRQDLQLRSIIEAVHDYAIYMLDRDGHVVTWNRGGERIHGYVAEEILGKNFARFFEQRDQDRGHPREMLAQAAERGIFEEEGWRVRKDGTRFWAQSVLTAIRDESGQLTGFAKVTRDHTDRKRAEEAVMLQLSAALLENMDMRKLLEAFSASIARGDSARRGDAGDVRRGAGRDDGAVPGAGREGSAAGRSAAAGGGVSVGDGVPDAGAGDSEADAGRGICAGTMEAPDGDRDAVGVVGSAAVSGRADWRAGGGEPDGGSVWGAGSGGAGGVCRPDGDGGEQRGGVPAGGGSARPAEPGEAVPGRRDQPGAPV